MTASAPAIVTRADAEAFLDERIGHGVQPGLDRITGLLAYMGDPQETYPAIHIAGTNGKTTVSRMVQQILGAHGLTTSGFTSPHLDSIEERFTVGGVPISSDEFVDAVRDIAWFVTAYEESAGTPVTYFEVTAALAFSIAASRAVDVAVVEVGLGGRLDATNVIGGAVSVVTGIDIDHTEFLGSTVTEIAAEKVAILSKGGTLVSGVLPADAIGPVASRVEACAAPWMRAGMDFSVVDAVVAVGGWQCTIEGVFETYRDLFLPVHGRHQVDNLATAIAACEMFLGRALDPELLVLAVASIRTPGRLEVLDRRPVILADGCHNPQGFRGLADTVDAEFPPMSWDLVLAVRGQRPIGDLLRPMKGRVKSVTATTVDDPAVRPAEEVAAEAGDVLGVPAEAVGDPTQALTRARAEAGPEGGVIVAGSLYLVGELRGAFGVADGATAEAHLHFEAPRVDDDDLGEWAGSEEDDGLG